MLLNKNDLARYNDDAQDLFLCAINRTSEIDYFRGMAKKEILL